MFSRTSGLGNRSLNSLFGAASLDPRSILTSIGEVVYDWDITGDALVWGANAAEVLGLDDIARFENGRRYAMAVEPDTGTTRAETILSCPNADEGAGVPYIARYGLRVAPHVLLCVEDTGRWFAGIDGKPAFAHGVIRLNKNVDETLLKQEHRSRDRNEFLRHANHEAKAALQAGRSVTILVSQIENLSTINDDLGYEIADHVIAETMRRMNGVMRRRDRMMRYSGNRFAILLSSCTSVEAETAAARFAKAVDGRPIHTDHGAVVVKLKIGAASLPDHALDAHGILIKAEEALVMARRSYGRHFVLYDHAKARKAPRNGGASHPIDFVDALNERRVTFARQPVVDAQSRNLSFCEALVRIKTPEGHLLKAGETLPQIERAGLVHLLDSRMLELVSQYLDEHPLERLSINVSPLTIEDTDWLPVLASHLGSRPGIAERLIIEITETAAVRYPLATQARLDAMKALGVAVAIDDFGAGHTSFKLLRSFPVDILKIDGAFIQNLARSADDRFFVRTLVDLAHHLNIATVAEWVEDEETALLLSEWGVDYLQGNHCGSAITLDEKIEEAGEIDDAISRVA
jgi:diguanylate cyclase (GGDEF)-like protein